MTYSCLVTGGAGFIGSHLVRQLLAEGHSVKVLDNFSTASGSNLEGLDVEVIEGDVRDREKLRHVMHGVEVVFHQAALPSVARSLADPIASHENNATGTLNVLVVARDTGVRRVVAASSSSVYGDAPVEWKREDLPIAPKSPYAVSKLATEQYCRAFFLGYGMETVALRYFNVFGPRQDPNSPYAAVIPLFINGMLKGEKPVVFGDGKQSRDFTYVENVVKANMLAAVAEKAAGEVFNVACGDSYSLLDLLESLNQILGMRVAPRFQEARAGDVRHSRADVSKAQEFLGYEPRVRFREGLRLTVGWHQLQS